MAVWDIVKKVVPGAAMLTAGATGAVALFVSPYGPFQPKPDVCPAGQTCVLVAGLDRDVNIGIGAGDQTFGFDINDEMTRRTVGWIDGAPDHVTVQKMPEEIAIPQLGVPHAADTRAHAVAHARELGRRYHATLVVIGEVNDNGSLDLQFVNPAVDTQSLKLVGYAVPQTGVPDHFLTDLHAALAATQGRRASESEVAGATDTINATNTPISAQAPATPQPPINIAPDAVRQASLSSEDRAQLERLISGFLQSTQQQLAGLAQAPNLSDEIAPLQPGGDDRWSVSLSGGVAYTIIGACDNECNNIDIVISNSNGDVLASDTLPDDVPIVNFTPPASGNYVVRTILRTCTIAPCFVGARVLVGADKPQR